MSVQKQSDNFTEAAYAFAKELVEAGEHPTISAAVSGELEKTQAERDRERSLLEVELERRRALPLEQWEPVGEAGAATDGARARISRQSDRNPDADHPPPVVERDLVDHIIDVTQGDVAAAERRLDELDALTASRAPGPASASVLRFRTGWCVKADRVTG